MENEHLLKQEYDAPAGCLIRLFWMIVGNALLFFCAMAIAQGNSSLFAPINALFWILVGSLLAHSLCRYPVFQRHDQRRRYGNHG